MEKGLLLSDSATRNNNKILDNNKIDVKTFAADPNTNFTTFHFVQHFSTHFFPRIFEFIHEWAPVLIRLIMQHSLLQRIKH